MAGKKSGKATEPRQILNRRARYDFQIIDSIEAGIVLVGSEVKSVFHGRAHLTDAFCRVVSNEMILFNMDIEPYEHTSIYGHERRRDRKLLLHRKQIDTLGRKTLEKGFALIPTRVYFHNGRVKVEVALARGKSEYDKRDKIAGDEARREVERARSEKY